MRVRLLSVLVFIFMSVVLAACGGSGQPSGVIEFKAVGGTYRVTAPTGWIESQEMMGYSAPQSPSGDMQFQVAQVDPTDSQMSAFPNPRNFTQNGREITIYDGLAGGRSTFNGVTNDSLDALYGLVTIGEHRYLAVFSRSITVTKDETQDTMFADMLASLELVP